MTPPADSQSATTDSSRLAINAEWFGRLRWVAAIGQLVTIGFVFGPLGVEAPVAPLLLLVGVTLISNSLYSWWKSSCRSELRASEWHAVLGGLMLLDLTVLTAMLALTGGSTNPFVVFYFVNLALSGVVLPAIWAWALSALAIVGFGVLTLAHQPVQELRVPERLESLTTLWSLDQPTPLAVIGGWVAFGASAIVIVNFTTRLTSELRASERLRRLAEGERARSEKLEALGTLAAGAAHELATPLSTIALVVSEAHRELEQSGGPPEAIEDLALARREVDRCRSILDRMATDSGQASASLPEPFSGADLVAEVLGELASASRIDVDWVDQAHDLQILAPRTALTQAIRAVVQNALDATDEVDPAGRVTITGDRLAETLRLAISDRGPGMPDDVLSRASEPFFTTKAPGSGMGLGLFLARSVIEKLGGSIRLESPESGGTTVTIVLPLAEDQIP